MFKFKQFCAPLFAALTLFSLIPAPQVKWQDNTLRRMLHWFPLIGVFQGAIWYGVATLTSLGFSPLIVAVMLVLSGIILTGAIHLDGFGDTVDAIGSRREVSRQLEIMKDSHIGAFGTIALIMVLFLQVTSWYTLVKTIPNWYVLAGGEIIMRCFTGLMVLALPKARADGLAFSLSQHASKREVILQIVLMLIASAITAYIGGMRVLYSLGILFGVCTIGVYRMVRHFNGVTGDMAGFWFVVGETLWLLLAVVGK